MERERAFLALTRASVVRLSRAFSLIELLTVIAIVAILGGLLGAPIASVGGAGNLTMTANNIAGILDEARAYAIANNTFVFVGIGEFDASTESSAAHQLVGIGRVVVAVVASRDGTRGYDAANASLSSPAWANYNNGANLVAISKLYRYDNFHLSASVPYTGGLARAALSSDAYQLGSAACSSVTPFDWPLGSAIGGGQYSFSKVINFDPQGVARIQYSSGANLIMENIEIGLSKSVGNTVVGSSNTAAIQIAGVTGAVHLYRP